MGIASEERLRGAVAWTLAAGVAALWSTPALAQAFDVTGPEIYIVAMMDALVSLIRRGGGPVIVLMVVFGAIMGWVSGDRQGAGGRIVFGLAMVALVASSVVWWPQAKAWFAA